MPPIRRNLQLILFQRHFWQPGVFEGKQSSEEESVHQVPIIIQQLHLDSQRPRQLALDDAEALRVRSSRRPDHFLNERYNLNAHFGERCGLLRRLSRVHQ